MSSSVCRWVAIAMLVASCGRVDQGSPPAAAADAALPTRGKITRVGAESFRWDYYDTLEPDSSISMLRGRGYDGGGDTWAGIVYGLVKMKQPTLWPQLQLDPAGGELTVWSKNREALTGVADLVSEAKRDPELLDAAIAFAEADDSMD